jgi:hypothetical protein
MKAGRKRKKGRREPNGRLQRPALPYQDVTAVALAQPHRRGTRDPRDPFHECPLGKFILARKLDRLSYDDALNFATLVRRVFSVRGIPQATKDGHVVRDGLGMTAEAARHLQELLGALEARLRKVSRSGFSALRTLAVFERATPEEQAEAVVAVLQELAAQGRGD